MWLTTAKFVYVALISEMGQQMDQQIIYKATNEREKKGQQQLSKKKKRNILAKDVHF